MRIATIAAAASLTVGFSGQAQASSAPSSGTTASASSASTAAAAASKHRKRVKKNKKIARKLLKKRGWKKRQYRCLSKLWYRESGWNHKARNRWSGAYGIPQALPGRKMRSAGRNWRTNPKTQIKWGLRYLKSRYGTPCGGWRHFQRRGWY